MVRMEDRTHTSYIGCFTLDLYCKNRYLDDYNHEKQYAPMQFVGKTLGECKAQARQAGWILSKEHAVCPLCKRRGFRG